MALKVALSQKDLDALVNRCLVFVDRNGTIITRDGSSMHSHLSMKYDRQGLEMMFSVTAGMGNGSSRIEIKHEGSLVLEAKGSFMTEAFACEAQTYVPGAWEKMIR